MENSDCRLGSVCGPQHICQDLTAPAVVVEVEPASDSVNGWFPRTADNVEVRVHANDGDGSGLASQATLTLAKCPADVPCSYMGVPLSNAGAGVISFQVPRRAQAPGLETPLPFTITVPDNAGNLGTISGVLDIDDVGPAIGTPFLVTAGTPGEDGRTWFLGGPTAPDVEVGIPVADAGSGLASLSLRLVASDVVPGTALNVLPLGPRGLDGAVHFKLPAHAVQGREGMLRFSLHATDMLQHATDRSGDPRDAIWVDALPPTISLAKVDYLSIKPTGPDCAPNAFDFVCGRQLDSTLKPTHLLRDDSATVTFDAIDCGAGVAATSQFSAAVKSGGRTMLGIPVTQSALLAGNCSNGSPNSTHRYKFTLNLVAMAPVLGPPDVGGTSITKIDSSGSDLLGQKASAISWAAAGDGVVLVSWWRWKKQLASLVGSPALLRDLPPPPVGNPPNPRSIVLATSAAIGNVIVLNPDGSPLWSATVSGLSGDVAVGAGNLLYAVIPGTTPCAPSNCPGGSMAIVTPPATGVQGTTTTCNAANAILGSPPALVTLSTNPPKETAVAVSLSHAPVSPNNLFTFMSGGAATCPAGSLMSGGDFNGITASGNSIFLAHGQGFSSFDQNGAGQFGTAAISYNPATVGSLAPPSILLAPAVAPIFGGDYADKTLRRTSINSCGPGITSTPCWTTATGFTPGVASDGLPYTPVFDSKNVWTADATGNVYAWNLNTGTPVFSSPPSMQAAGKAGPPVLLSDGSALVATDSGALYIVQPSLASAPLRLIGAGGTAAPLFAPVLDKRDSSGTGIAYVASTDRWLYAWQLPVMPLPATTSTWPRPGHDSCNTRNTDPSCP